MKIRFHSYWQEQFDEGDWPGFAHFTVLQFGRVDFQYYIIFFNFTMIIEI